MGHPRRRAARERAPVRTIAVRVALLAGLAHGVSAQEAAGDASSGDAAVVEAPLAVGRTVAGRLPGPREREADSPPHVLLPLPPGVSGWITVAVESDAFDVALSVFDAADRARFVGDEDSGPGPAARVELRADPGVRYAVRVLAQDGLGGAFRVDVRAGRAPSPVDEDEEVARIAFYEAAARLALVEGDTRHAQACSLRAGALAARRGEVERAVGPLEEAARLAAGHDDVPGRLAAGLLLARALAEDWRFDEACGHAEEVATLAEEAGRTETAFDVLVLLAAGEETLGRTEALTRTLPRLRAAAEELDAPWEAARSDGRLALALQELGDVRGALEAHRVSVRGLRALAEPAPDDAVELLWLAARLRGARGEPDLALRFLEEAVALRPSRLQALRVLGEQALATVSLGDWTHARLVMARFDAMAGPRATTGVLWTRATFAARTADRERARAAYDALLASLPEEAVAWRVEALTSRAVVEEGAGDDAAAEASLHEALALARDAGLARHEETVHGALGALLLGQGAHEEAATHHRMALASARGRDDAVAVAVARSGLGRALDAQGKHDEAAPALAAAVDALLDRGRVAEALAPLEALALAARRRDDRADLAGHLVRAEEVFDAVGPAPVRALRGVSPGARWAALAADLAAARLAASAELSVGGRGASVDGAATPSDAGDPPVARAADGQDPAGAPDLGVTAAADTVVDGFGAVTRWKERALLEGLGRPATPVDPAALLDVLGPVFREGAVLVDFAEGLERLYAFVLRDGALSMHDLGARAELLADVELFTAQVDGTVDADPDALAATGRALRERLLGPAWTDGAPERLVVVPSVGLVRLPFEALVLERTDVGGWAGLVHLADRCVVSSAPTSRALAEAVRAPRDGAPAPAVEAWPGAVRVSALDPADTVLARRQDARLGLVELLGTPLHADVVVATAVTDAPGPVARGAGLASLAGAWMRAGARAVVVTRRPLPDEEAQAFVGRLTTTLAARSAASTSHAVDTLREELRARAVRDGLPPSSWAGVVLFGD